MSRLRLSTGFLLAVAVGAAALVIVPAAGAVPTRAQVHIPPPPCLPEVEHEIMVNTGSYSPSTMITHTPGSASEWDWVNSGTASVTTTGRLPMLHSRVKSAGTYSFTFWSAGTYAYHSSIDASQKGVVAVGICNVPKAARAGSVMWLQPASAHRPGWVADIEVLRPGATEWAWLRYDVATTVVSLRPERIGTYEFRARLRDKAIRAYSGFSPVSETRVS
jgi:plastocyanin